MPFGFLLSVYVAFFKPIAETARTEIFILNELREIHLLMFLSPVGVLVVGSISHQDDLVLRTHRELLRVSTVIVGVVV